MDKLTINLIVLILLCLGFIYLEIKIQKTNMENFETNRNENNILIKKTNKYNKIYSHKNYTIWEAEPIDDYFPIGQQITKNKSPPEKSSLLVKSNKDLQDRPKGYMLIGSTEDSVPIWKPISNNGYASMGHIFSKKKPSIHKYRCVKKNLCDETNINRKVYLKSLVNKENHGYTIWDIRDSDRFVCMSLNNGTIPDDDVYKINSQNFMVEQKISIKKTKLYEKIWSYKNPKNKQDVTIWKPQPLGDFVPIGYIALASTINPNKKMESILVNKDHVKPPLEYGDKSILNLSVKTSKNLKKYSFWRPVPPKGYVCLSDIIVNNFDEPKTNDLVYCIPQEYMVDEGMLKEIWNSIPQIKNKISVFVDNNNFFRVNNDYSTPSIPSQDLNYNFVDIETDKKDLERKATLTYETNENLTEILDSEKKITLFLDSLSNRLGVHKKRFKDITFEQDKINLKITAKPHGSGELTSYEIKKNLSDIVNNGGLKINNSKKDGFIFTITKLEIFEPVDNKIIKLDNRNFSDRF